MDREERLVMNKEVIEVVVGGRKEFFSDRHLKLVGRRRKNLSLRQNPDVGDSVSMCLRYENLNAVFVRNWGYSPL